MAHKMDKPINTVKVVSTVNIVMIVKTFEEVLHRREDLLSLQIFRSLKFFVKKAQ